MKKPKLAHSYWHKPKLKKMRNGFSVSDNEYADLLCAANSVMFAKRNGLEISLYTDTAGHNKFGFLPYDDVVICLENHNANTALWASGKIEAYQYMPQKTIHIDMDAYIKRPMCVELLEQLENYDLIVQNKEYNYNTDPHYSYVVREVVNLVGEHITELPEFDLSIDVHSYSCGFVGFNSEELKARYIEGYRILHDKITTCAGFAERNQAVCLDLIVEQAYLQMAATYLKKNVFGVLSSHYEENHAFSRKIGYTHLTHISKYHPKVIKKNEALLKEISPEIHKKVLEFKP